MNAHALLFGSDLTPARTVGFLKQKFNMSRLSQLSASAAEAFNITLTVDTCFKPSLPLGLIGNIWKTPIRRDHSSLHLDFMSAFEASENTGPSLFPLDAGPPLPDFSSLLVHGAYHPSAPLHLCFSASRIGTSGLTTSELPDLAADAPVLLITANKDALKDGLRAGGWQRTGRSMQIAKQVQVL